VKSSSQGRRWLAAPSSGFYPTVDKMSGLEGNEILKSICDLFEGKGKGN
jgi:hypothetical protein